MALYCTLNLKTLRRINDQGVKSGGDGKVSLVNQKLVVSNIMDTGTLKQMKHSIKRNKNRRCKKNVVGMGREDGKV